jgi:hypothetical protein
LEHEAAPPFNLRGALLLINMHRHQKVLFTDFGLHAPDGQGETLTDLLQYGTVMPPYLIGLQQAVKVVVHVPQGAGRNTDQDHGIVLPYVDRP